MTIKTVMTVIFKVLKNIMMMMIIKMFSGDDNDHDDEYEHCCDNSNC